MRVTDKEGKSIEAISDIVRVGMITTAEVGEVLEGETYITGEGKLETGEMTNNAALNIEVEPGETKTIPQGYHDGKGTVSTNSEVANKMTVKALKTQTAYWSSNQTATAEVTYTVEKKCTCIAIALLSCVGGYMNGGPLLGGTSASITLNGTSVDTGLVGSIYYGYSPRMYMFDVNPGDTIYVSCSGTTKVSYLTVNAVIMTDE